MHEGNETVNGTEYSQAPGLLVHRHEKHWKITHMVSGMLVAALKQWYDARDFAIELSSITDFTKSTDDILSDTDSIKQMKELRENLPENKVVLI